MDFLSYPNMKKVVTHKEECHSDFLQINNSEWHYAARVLSPAAFKLYLYFASNKNGFGLWLSREAVNKTIGICKTAYYNGLRELERFGYLIARTSSTYEFSTTPIRSDNVIAAWQSKNIQIRFLIDYNADRNFGNDSRTFGTAFHSEGKEIYNTYKDNTEKTDGAASRSYGNFEMEPFEDWFARLPEKERDKQDPEFWFGPNYDPDDIPLDWPNRDKCVRERTNEIKRQMDGKKFKLKL